MRIDPVFQMVGLAAAWSSRLGAPQASSESAGPGSLLVREESSERLVDPRVDGVSGREQLFEGFGLRTLARHRRSDCLRRLLWSSRNGTGSGCARARFSGALFGMTRSAERLEILVAVRASVDQRNDVVQFPERLTRLVASLADRSCSTAADLAQFSSYSVGVDSAGGTAPPIALADPPTSFARVSRVVGIDALRMPAAAAIDFVFLVARGEEDVFATPAADASRCVREGNLGASVVRHSVRSHAMGPSGLVVHSSLLGELWVK